MILALDHRLFFFIRDLPHTILTDTLALWFSGIGAGGLVFWLLAILLFIFYEKKDPPASALRRSRWRAGRWFFLPVISAAGLSYFITELCLKHFFVRNRPPGSVMSDYSFPSGHATFAWALAVVLAAKEPRFKYLFFLLAFLISLSRIYLGVHYPSDVIAGSFLGIMIGWLSLTLGNSVRPGSIRKSRVRSKKIQ